VSRSGLPSLLRAALLCGVMTLPGCGGGEQSTDGRVSIEVDAGPKGSLALIGGDPAAGSASARVPVTRKGIPTVIYRAPVRELTEGMRLRAIANVTLTKCAITDYIPNQRAHTACQGTREYDYDPVDIATGFRLVGGRAAPDPSISISPLGPSQHTTCTTKIHHCTISQDYEVTVSGSEARSDARWVIFEATATSPKAKGCTPLRASDCNVLAVETQKGTAMYWVQEDGSVPQPDSLPADRSENQAKLPVLTGHGDKNDVRKVVYSADIGDPHDLAGAQFEVGSLLKIAEQLPQAPDVATYLVLSDSPTGIAGRYLISDSYDPGKTGNAGGNCDETCSVTRPAVATTIQPCDVSAGRRFVNLVAASSRAAAKRGETVSIADGGYVEVSRMFPAGVSTGGGSAGGCGR
jgi:hypothetical protein